MPIIPPNNTTGLYGVDTTVQINNNIFGNNLVLTGNAVVGGTISAAGNITTGGNFIGDFIGNISGNVNAAGSNTQVQFNNSGLLGADADFTFDTSTNSLTVPTLVGNVVRGPGDGNIIIRNTAAVNNLTGNAVYLDSNNVFMGNIGNRARFNAAPSTDLQIVGAGSGTEILLVRNGGFDSGFGNTGNIDMRSKAVATGGGFRADGNINLAGNVYIGSYGAQIVGNSRGNLRVQDTITGNSISAVGNVTAGNVIGSFLWGDGSNITGVIGGSKTVQIPVKNTSGGPLTKGTPVYATGTVGSTDVLEVSASRADTPATMPTIGLLETNLSNNAQGYAISVGSLLQINTSAYAINEVLYVAPTGGLTNTRPNDGYIVQPIGTAGRIGVSGSIQTNIWNFFQLPNLGSGNIWIGNANSVPTQFTLSSYTGNIGAGNITVGSGGTPGRITINSGNTGSKGRLVSTYISGELDNNANGGVSFTQPGTTNGLADGNIFAGNATVTGTVSVGGNVITLNRTLSQDFEAYNSGNTSSNVKIITSTATATITTTGTISAAGNITGNYFIGNGSALTGITATASPAGANTQIQFNDAGVAGASANLTFNKTSNTLSTTAISVTGNITGANINTGGLSLSGNVVSPLNVTGNIAGANLNATTNTTTGNITITLANNNIQNINAWNPNVALQPARITVGTGYDGDYSTAVDPLLITRGAQLAVINKQVIGNADVNQAVRALTGIFYADMNGATLTNPARRMQGLGGALAMGNGTMSLSTGPLYPAAAGGGGALQVGNIFLSGVGTFQNTTTSLSHGAGTVNNILVGGNATIGNAVASFNQVQFISNNTGNVRTAMGAYASFTGGSSGQPVPGNVYGYYMPGTTNNHGVTNSNFWRVADNYYFLVNEDDVAQNRLGSLRRYHEFNGVSGTTSGSLTIDKNNGQVQQVNLTGNISSLAYSNFVTSASDSVNTDEQCDTVTIVFNQGSTGGYGVTFPTGSQYKYAGNVTALQSTAANSVSLVSVSAVRIGGTTTYLTTISPGFV